jgi:hypothetical protein
MFCCKAHPHCSHQLLTLRVCLFTNFYKYAIPARATIPSGAYTNRTTSLVSTDVQPLRPCTQASRESDSTRHLDYPYSSSNRVAWDSVINKTLWGCQSRIKKCHRSLINISLPRFIPQAIRRVGLTSWNPRRHTII